MTRENAIAFIENSDSEFFRYGDLGYVTSKANALEDIQNMEDEVWGDGDVLEAEQAFNEEGEQDHLYYEEAVKILNNAQWKMEPIAELMDDEIRETLHNEISPCSDLLFVEIYLEQHEKKYGVKFDFS
ncbi:hypothetical protein [Sphaerochaeta sp. S2]|uniref:hypothetical protein n=1 Tax=Sphaerochaeta sp. S2 TaxID=2798868 RepID=UPI0018EA1337|nr:hypothetical protein [Sphaerochaeta sp. S2]MBJ2355830.1 hypothetical protein [Sphaerochaeta sp. S2]